MDVVDESAPIDSAEQDVQKDEYVDFDSLKEKVGRFVRDRDWDKYHNPKDIAISIAVEAGELLEIFQWMQAEEVARIKENAQTMDKIRGELADVMNHCISMANRLDLDIPSLVIEKLKKAEKKYPVDKYRGEWKKPV